MAQLIGNRYELIEQIGAGGMGTVYRGIDMQTGQIVAVKQLKAEISSPEMIERFKREGEALRQLNHPNIIRMLAMLDDADQHYLIMDYIAGGSLADLLRESKRVDLPRVLNLALDLSDALTRTHRLNVLHRDLKPANVLIAEDGTPRLTDFGVAHIDSSDLTNSGQVVGTLAYLSPEALNGETLDERSDLWAFGVILFELLTGQHPFPAQQFSAQVTAILMHPLPDMETLRPDLPVALVDLVYRMLEKDRQRRISSARLVGAELETILRVGQAPQSASVKWTGADESDSTSFVSYPTPTPTVNHNLPEQPTAFVGREAELSELAALLAKPDVRLITILGPGGMGKTRLALEVARQQLARSKDGVFFVSLAPLSDPNLIVTTIADAIRFQFAPGETPKNQLLSYLRDKSMLLDLDNFEHLLTGIDFISDLLQTAAGIRLLVTSRERLNIQWETVVRIEGMDFPDWESPADAAEYSAVKLFLQSARRVAPTFELSNDNLSYLARICRQVYGMPLGIVLAAAWLDNLSLSEISSEIERSFDFLESDLRDLPERQRSMRSVFDYSWALLTASERVAVNGLSVFRGGFTRDAAQQVMGVSLKTLNNLVNKSLLQRDSAGRYGIHELLRQYIEQQLRAHPSDFDAARDRHAFYYADVIGKLWDQIRSPKAKEAADEIDQEIDNVRTAWTTIIDRNHLSQVTPMVRVLWVYLNTRAYRNEGLALFAPAVDKFRALPAGELRDLALAEVLHSLGSFQLLSDGASELALRTAKESLAILQNYHVPEIMVRAFIPLLRSQITLASYSLDDNLKALGLAELVPDFWYQGYAIFMLGMSYLSNGDLQEAELSGKKAIKFCEHSGDPILLGLCYGLLLPRAAFGLGRFSEAKQWCEQGIIYFERVNSPYYVAIVNTMLARSSALSGEHKAARSAAYKSLKYYTSAGMRHEYFGCVIDASILFEAHLDFLNAVELAAQVLNHKESWKNIKDEAQLIIDRLRPKLSTDDFAAAWERGKALDLDTVVAELLASSDFADNSPSGHE